MRNAAPQKAALPPPKAAWGDGDGCEHRACLQPPHLPLGSSNLSSPRGKRKQGITSLHPLCTGVYPPPPKSPRTAIGVFIPAATASPLPACLLPYPPCHSPSSPSGPPQSLWHNVTVRPSHSQNTGNSGSVKTEWKEWMCCTPSPRP